jgi:hypothetical protein
MVYEINDTLTFAWIDEISFTKRCMESTTLQST